MVLCTFHFFRRLCADRKSAALASCLYDNYLSTTAAGWSTLLHYFLRSLFFSENIFFSSEHQMNDPAGELWEENGLTCFSSVFFVAKVASPNQSTKWLDDWKDCVDLKKHLSENLSDWKSLRGWRWLLIGQNLKKTFEKGHQVDFMGFFSTSVSLLVHSFTKLNSQWEWSLPPSTKKNDTVFLP